MQNGGPIVVAAAILGACIVGAALVVSNAVGKIGTELASLQGAASSIRYAIEQAAKASPQQVAQQPQRRRGPDPNRVYKVNIDGSPSKGPENAAVTLVEFSDFQCPFCRRVNPTFEKIEQEYGDKVRVVFKHLPLSIHAKAPAAHAASEAAHRQGKFWEMHDKIFANQRDLSESNYDKWAGELGLDVAKFTADRQAAEVKRRVSRDASEAAALGVTGTPAFFINGKFFSGAQPYEAFKAKIDEALAG